MKTSKINEKYAKRWKIDQKKLYDLWAKSTKIEPLSKFWEFYGNFEHREIRFLDKIDGKMVLDIGCRDGRFIRELNSKGAHVIGIDVSMSCIKLAGSKVSTKLTGFVVCDAEKLPFKAESFECVTVLFVLHHLPGFVVFKEIHRVLKRDGILLLDEIVQNNPILAFGRKIFPKLSSSIRARVCQDVESSIEDGSDRGLFTVNELQKALYNSNFRVISKRGYHLFLFPLEYLIRLFPILTFFFTDKFLFRLYRLETILLERSFEKFCRIVIIKCIKKW